MTEIIYTQRATEDRNYWQKHNVQILKRIDQLITDIQRDPFRGIGKPEPLRFNYSGYWSRRINNEHRLVYKIQGECVYIVQCRYHYE